MVNYNSSLWLTLVSCMKLNFILIFKISSWIQRDTVMSNGDPVFIVWKETKARRLVWIMTSDAKDFKLCFLQHICQLNQYWASWQTQGCCPEEAGVQKYLDGSSFVSKTRSRVWICANLFNALPTQPSQVLKGKRLFNHSLFFHPAIMFCVSWVESWWQGSLDSHLPSHSTWPDEVYSY